MAKRFLLIMAMVFLAACGTKPEPSVTATVFQYMGTTPELETTVVSWLTNYNSQSDTRSLHLEVLPKDQLLSAINTDKIGLAILGEEPPEDWFVTPIMREAIVVIVNPENAIQSLSLLDLEEIFSGKITTWESLTDDENSVQLMIPFKGNIFRDRFYQVILKDLVFEPSSRLASTRDDMLEFVRTNEGAIGFLPSSQLGDGVEVVEIDDISPSESETINDQYPLWVDIIATSPQEPLGSLRDFLIWLQGTYLSS